MAGKRETLGARLRRLRERAGLSQRDVATGLERVTSAYVSRIETDDRDPSIQTLVRIASKLPGVTALELLTGDAAADCPVCCRRHDSIGDELERAIHAIAPAARIRSVRVAAGARG